MRKILMTMTAGVVPVDMRSTPVSERSSRRVSAAIRTDPFQIVLVGFVIVVIVVVMFLKIYFVFISFIFHYILIVF